MAKFTEAYQSYRREVAEASEEMKSGEIDKVEFFDRMEAAQKKYGDDMSQADFEDLLEVTTLKALKVEISISEINKELARRGLPTRPIPGQDPEKPN